MTVGGLAGQGLLLGSAAAAWSTLSPWSRELKYQANFRTSNVVPDPPDLIRLWYSGKLNNNQLYDLLGCHGIHWARGQTSSYTRIAWQGLLDLAQPTFGLDDWLHWKRQGRVTQEELTEQLERHGYYRVKERSLFAEQYQDLQAAEVLANWLRGDLTTEQVGQRLRILGYRDSEIYFLLHGQKEQLAPGDLVTLRNRGLLDNQQWGERLKWHGYLGNDQPALLDVLRHPILPPSDLVHLAVKEAWDDQVAAQFGYDAEFPQKFRDYMAQHGLAGGEPVTLADGRVVSFDDWAKLIWRGHWATLPPSDAATFMHRARGNPNDPATWRIPGVKPFTRADFDLAMRINDRPPAYRDWYAATSFRVMRLVDIRRALQLKIYGEQTRAWAIEQWQDGGQTLANATTLADLADATQREKDRVKVERRQERLHGRTVQQFMRGYRSGWVTRESIETYLRNIGWDEESIALLLAESDYILATQTAESGLKRAQQDFFSGRDTLDGIRRRFTLLGIQPEFGEQIIQRWINMRGEGRIMLAAGKVLDYFKRGLLPLVEVLRRLANLGWAETDARLLIAAAEQDLMKLAGKAALAEQKAARAAAKELERLQHESMTMTRAIESRLRTLTPIGTVKRWYAQRIVERDWFLERLAAMGVPSADAERYFSEAEEMRSDEDRKEESEADSGTEETTAET
jgi:hypothetical protein